MFRPGYNNRNKIYIFGFSIILIIFIFIFGVYRIDSSYNNHSYIETTTYSSPKSTYDYTITETPLYPNNSSISTPSVRPINLNA